MDHFPITLTLIKQAIGYEPRRRNEYAVAHTGSESLKSVTTVVNVESLKQFVQAKLNSGGIRLFCFCVS